jgi:PIN domain nuclease of toxin-antitoxin system
LGFLIDTHVLIWAVEGSRRLSTVARDTLLDPDSDLNVSAVTAWEFADLRARGRLPAIADFARVADLLAFRVLDLPGALWQLAADLPNHHGDPADRMLIAHAIHADLTLITADGAMREYPVRTLW